MLKAENAVIKKLQHQWQIKNYIWEFQPEQETPEDIWQIQKTDSEKDNYFSLFDALYKVELETQKGQKIYSIEHGFLYNLLTK